MPFYITRENLFAMQAGIVLSKHCSFAHLINQAISGLKEFGIMKQYLDKLVPLQWVMNGFQHILIRKSTRPLCSFSKAASVSRIQASSSERPLDLEPFYTSLMFLCCSYAVWALMFLAEARQGNEAAKDGPMTGEVAWSQRRRVAVAEASTNFWRFS